MPRWGIPGLGAIQRTNAVLVVATALVLARFLSRAAAVGCLLGGAVVIGNLFLLALMGRVALAAAGTGSRAARLGAVAIPLKLLLVIGLVYLVFTRAHVDGLGFGAGILTQLAATIIETGRAALRGES